jgi:predicted secreted protein
MTKIEVGQRIGIGAGRLFVKDISQANVQFEYNRKANSNPEFAFEVPLEIAEYLSQVEALEKKCDSQRKTIDYWKKKAESTLNLEKELQSAKSYGEQMFAQKNKLTDENSKLVLSNSRLQTIAVLGWCFFGLAVVFHFFVLG